MPHKVCFFANWAFPYGAQGFETAPIWMFSADIVESVKFFQAPRLSMAIENLRLRCPHFAL